MTTRRAPFTSTYTFPNVAAYLAAKNKTACPISGVSVAGLCYTSFSTVLGVPGASYKSNFYDFFVQDSWQLRPNLLVIYGVRYDYYQAPAGRAQRALHLQPELPQPEE